MLLLLIHHADAVGDHVDPQRPLSTHGYEHALRLAQAAKDHGVVPQIIWHSGKLRARQTGEAFLRNCAPFAQFKMVRGLSPEDPPAVIIQALGAFTHGSNARDLALVGHWPHMPALLAVLSPSSAPMPQHGAVALTTEDHGLTWTESWRG